MSQRHPLKDGSYCIPGPFHRPPYETCEIWVRAFTTFPSNVDHIYIGGEVWHLGRAHLRCTKREVSTGVDSCGQVKP